MQTFLYGGLGGLAINIVRLAELAHTPKIQRPATGTDPFFWIQFIGLPLVGGFLAHVYQASGTSLSPILAVNIGASAPLIFKNLAAAVPRFGQQKID